MDIMTAVCEIKKVTACEENFWERDIHYVIKSDGIRTYFNEMKTFLFQLYMLYVNVLTILFLMMIEICFGFNSHNVKLCVINFCFEYYLGKRRPPQVYIEINDCTFRLKKWTQ